MQQRCTAFLFHRKKEIGKTSLAEFVKQYLEDRRNALGIYVSNKGQHSLENLVAFIFDAFLNEYDPQF